MMFMKDAEFFFLLSVSGTLNLIIRSFEFEKQKAPDDILRL